MSHTTLESQHKESSIKEKPLPLKLFREVEKHFTLPSVECIIIKNDGVVLVKRKMIPHKGFWTTPGAIILKGERFFDAAKRVTKREVNAIVKPIDIVGVYEFITPERHNVAVAVLCKYVRGDLRVNGIENEDVCVITNPSEFNIHEDHKKMIRDAMVLAMAHGVVRRLGKWF